MALGFTDTRNQFVWSPDGTKILFVSDGGNPSVLDVIIMNSDGSNQINLTNDLAGRALFPVFLHGSAATLVKATSWGQVKADFR